MAATMTENANVVNLTFRLEICGYAKANAEPVRFWRDGAWAYRTGFECAWTFRGLPPHNVLRRHKNDFAVLNAGRA